MYLGGPVQGSGSYGEAGGAPGPVLQLLLLESGRPAL